jgi:hypothetical protein
MSSSPQPVKLRRDRVVASDYLRLDGALHSDQGELSVLLDHLPLSLSLWSTVPVERRRPAIGKTWPGQSQDRFDLVSLEADVVPLAHKSVALARLPDVKKHFQSFPKIPDFVCNL